MLQDARLEVLGVHVHGLAVLVLGVDGDAHVALHGHAQRPERETALLVDRSLVRALDDDGIDERPRLGVLAIGAVHEHAAQQADLVAGEADAVGVVHERDHALARARAGRPRTRSPARAGSRSTGSGYWRIWLRATISRARARASRSSSFLLRRPPLGVVVIMVVIVIVVVVMIVLVVVIVIVFGGRHRKASY